MAHVETHAYTLLLHTLLFFFLSFFTHFTISNRNRSMSWLKSQADHGIQSYVGWHLNQHISDLLLQVELVISFYK